MALLTGGLILKSLSPTLALSRSSLGTPLGLGGARRTSQLSWATLSTCKVDCGARIICHLGCGVGAVSQPISWWSDKRANAYGSLGLLPPSTRCFMDGDHPFLSRCVVSFSFMVCSGHHVSLRLLSLLRVMNISPSQKKKKKRKKAPIGPKRFDLPPTPFAASSIRAVSS